MKKELAKKLKTESEIARLEKQGIKVDSLKRDLKKKEDGHSERVSK